MWLTDTHCHLDMHQFDEDREDVINRAFDSGVQKMLIPGIDLESSRSAVEIADKYPQIFAAVGVHPNSAGTWDAETLGVIEELSNHTKVVAIGEIGLDYYWDTTPHEKQEQIFGYQLDLALDKDLPIVVHNREATYDILRMISNWYQQVVEVESILVERPGVLHSYSGNIEEASQAASNGFFFGVTGPVTFKNADDLRRVVKNIELDRILVETDSPYLSPEPLRGKRNEPINVQHIAEKIATIRDMEFDELVHTTYSNAERLFQW